jgi:glutamine synthetase
MSGNSVRLKAIEAVIEYKLPTPIDFAADPTGEMFGKNVFNLGVMKERLSKDVYKKLAATIATGSRLDESTADAVASAMKSWAIERGATHFGHIFYPLTGLTAEKNDSFYSPNLEGKVISEFTGVTLIQGEPDGSSFPTGGVRPTHEARGYTAWDVTSPAYLTENPNGITLNIPTAFVSWSGEALDLKTPLMRSMKALNTQAQRVLAQFGDDDGALVTATAGPEQEYFLVDRRFFLARPDLLSAGRTLFGASSAKGQQFDDHYFGAINERVQACMFEFERELFKLGVPVKTRHNEVAPSQYEIAPLHENANVAADHQQLIMTTLKKVAEKYDLVCLLHEKPFAGVNGSGKHVNFSFGSATQGNLLDPGDNPHDNAKFLVFCASVIRAVSLHAKLLRASVAAAGNDHRLGANEAPPAIISIFLGDQLTDVFEQIKNAGIATSSKEKGTLKIGVDTLPELPKDSGDRNRTSPFAFTGNRFEFRAVGSQQSIAFPLTVLNTIIAESLDYIATKLEKADDLFSGIESVLQTIMKEHGHIIFNGDGYADAWQVEAKRRGLPNLKTSAEAIPEIASEESFELFGKYGVLSEREVHSRYEVAMEQFVMAVTVEAKLMLEMGRTMIFPAAIRYQSELARTCANLKAVGYEFDTNTLDKVTELIKLLQDNLFDLEELLSHDGEDLLLEAQMMQKQVRPKMDAVRKHADALEGFVADDLWPLPTYQEMLFIK